MDVRWNLFNCSSQTTTLGSNITTLSHNKYKYKCIHTCITNIIYYEYKYCNVSLNRKAVGLRKNKQIHENITSVWTLCSISKVHMISSSTFAFQSFVLLFQVRVIPIQLQRLFASLLLKNSQSVSSKDLTNSFGWTDNEVRQFSLITYS